MHPTPIDLSKFRLFFEPRDRLRLTIGEDRSYVTVRPAWSSPLSHPNRFLALVDGKGDEIATIREPKELPKESLAAVEIELRRRYLAPTISKITHAKVEFGATYWHVETDRGPRDFVTQSLQENAQWLSETHLVLVDVDQNRFEIPNIHELDPDSLRFIHMIL